MMSNFTKRYILLVYTPMLLSLVLLTFIIEPVDNFVDTKLLNIVRPYYGYNIKK